MRRRKIRDEADARSCITAVRASGLAPKAWALSAGIDGRSLRAWTMNLARRASPKNPRPSRTGLAKPVQLVELVPARTSRMPSRYVVRVGTHYVELDEHFDGATLRRLVAVLSAC
jgi:hypothetical protein